MSLFEKLREPKWVVVSLLLIIMAGTFLRVYQYHDFLRFNADQSRDATLVRDYLAGKEELPLLGPKAGGTSFRVGPAFYYFQIASAKIFGSHPDTVAYPDLLFSLLALPLLFFFLRKYFDSKTALLLVALFAVSLYAIKYSRFAWNPNSLPFWSMLFLYGLHEIMVERERIWKWWAVLTGGCSGYWRTTPFTLTYYFSFDVSRGFRLPVETKKISCLENDVGGCGSSSGPQYSSVSE